MYLNISTDEAKEKEKDEKMNHFSCSHSHHSVDFFCEGVMRAFFRTLYLALDSVGKSFLCAFGVVEMIVGHEC